MTTHYQNIVLLPDAELVPQVLMSMLFSKLHKALVSAQTVQVGVSFPEQKEHFLGNVLRLHGSAVTLDHLDALSWLGGLRGYVQLGAVVPVPLSVLGYCTVRRRQAQSNPDRLRRRMMRRKGITWEQAVQALPDACGEMLDLPFVQLHSSSTGENFRLFIEQGALRQEATEGTFSQYGLSSKTTIPFF